MLSDAPWFERPCVVRTVPFGDGVVVVCPEHGEWPDEVRHVPAQPGDATLNARDGESLWFAGQPDARWVVLAPPGPGPLLLGKRPRFAWRRRRLQAAVGEDHESVTAEPAEPEDPGWGVAMKAGMRKLMVFVPSPRLMQAEMLTGLRVLFLGQIAAAVAIFGAVPLTLGADESRAATPFVVAVAAVGLLCLALGRLLDGQLDCTTRVSLAMSWKIRFYRRLAFAQLPLFAGFVAAAILTGNAWVYLVAVPFAVPGFIWAAPTKGQLKRDQVRLIRSGCGQNLVAALRSKRGV